MENLQLYAILLNLPSLRINGVEVEESKITIACELQDKTRACSKCGNQCSHVHQRYERTVRDLNIAAREVYLVVKIRQFYCPHCQRYFSEQLDFADANKSHTHRQENFMFMVSRKQSYAESAVILNVHPKTVERTVLSFCRKQADLERRYAEVRRLGIDEQSQRKGKKDYICVLTDLDKGRLVDILPSRKKEDLLAHFRSQGRAFCEQITDVSCDGWQGYISVAQRCFPQATIVLDRFHVVQLLNKCLDDVRQKLRKSAPDNTNYRRLKWILYKQYPCLSQKERQELEACFTDSPVLKEIYWTRERFHHILDNGTQVEEVLARITQWKASMSTEVARVFKPFCTMLERSKEYVANYVKDRLSNGITEGLNNLIRSVKRAAFGMPNFENLRWRALALSE